MARKDYEIGYRKPPTQYRFKKGQSGNPKGRPKGTKNLLTDVLEELAEKSNVTIGGEAKRLSNQRIMVKAQSEKAKRGDPRAFDALLRVILQKYISEFETNPDEVLSDVDEALIDDFVKHWGARKQANEPTPEKEDWSFLD